MQRASVVTLLLISAVFSSPFRHVIREWDDILKEPNNPVGNAKGFILAQRNVYQFSRMIGCQTNRTWISYIDYGCYCGLGGRGQPVDATDRSSVEDFPRNRGQNGVKLPKNDHKETTDKCCQIHDACYGFVDKAGLCSSSLSTYWNVYNRDNTCTGCADKEGTCERAICECDGAAARCFSLTEYNQDNFNYPQDNC